MSGTVVLSLDFELAWGHLDVARLDPVLDAARWVAAEGAARVLRALVDRELPATWATVGALAKDGWDPAVDLDPAVVRGKPWELPVPLGGTERSDPAFFGPSLVDRIQAAPGQELGFHGYTHLSFTDPAMSPRRADQELAACRALAEARGFDGVSWVFPRNHVGHLDALERHGIGVYRDVDRQRLPGGKRIQLLEGLAADWMGASPPTVSPHPSAGMVALPGSGLLAFAVGKRRQIPDAWRLRCWRGGIERAARTGRVFHGWLHPINLFPEPERKLEVFERFLDDVAAARDTGEVVVRPMGQYRRRFA